MKRSKMALALLVGVAMLMVAGPLSPAGALGDTDVEAEVSGQVTLTGNACTTADGEAGELSVFSQVVITGRFSVDAADAVGTVAVQDVNACVVTDIAVGPVPVLSHGTLAAAGFNTPSTDLAVNTDPDTALSDPTTCVSGSITGGSFTTAGAVAIADVPASYSILSTSSNCGSAGASLGSSASLSLTAVIGAVPVGEIVPGQPNTVAGIVTN